MIASSLCVERSNNQPKKMNNMEQDYKPIVDYIEDFLVYSKIERGIAERTIDVYETCTRGFVNWLKNNGKQEIKPNEFSKDDIWQYRLYLSKCLTKNGEPLKKNTQNHYLIVLRSFLKYFSAKDITALPCEKVSLAKDANREKPVKFLNFEQVKKLLDAPDTNTFIGLRDKVMLEILFSTGLRVSELASLNRNQFDSIQDQEDLELCIIGKGSYPRTVFFSKRAIYWLKKYLELRNDSKEPLLINFKSSIKTSERLSTRSIERIVKDYVKKSELPLFVSPHTLRHSYATDLMNQGVDLRSVQEFLGHRSIMTTQIYTHVTNIRLREIHRQCHNDAI